MASSKTAILVVNILGDAKDAQKALKDTEKAIAQAENTTKKSGKKMAGVWTGVAAAMIACVRASSHLEQATNALNTIFGEQADEMTDWAEGMAQYGLSTAQASAAAAVLGAQLKNAGLTAEQMTVVTQGLIEVSTQLAAVMGGTAVDAVQAMGAAMRGEFDSLEKYGISLTADAVATEAARLASEGYTFATEQQGKMVATVSLIQQQATTILGDAETQTVSMSTATSHLRASLSNLAATIGGALTPTLGPLIEGLATTIDRINEQAQASELLATISETLSGVLAAVADILDPVLNSALQLVADVADKLADLIDRYVIPVLEVLADVLDTVADALNTVIGWVNSAIAAFDRFIDKVHEAIDSLTFWNDTYQSSAASTFALPAPTLPSPAAFGPAALAGQTVNVTVQAGMVADPHALAREIRRVLQSDAVRMGRAT